MVTVMKYRRPVRVVGCLPGSPCLHTTDSWPFNSLLWSIKPQRNLRLIVMGKGTLGSQDFLCYLPGVD